MLAALTVVVLAAATVATAHGAEIVLRQQATLTGSILRLGDVADIGADSASQKHDLATTPLMPVPAPGTVRFLRAAEIRDMLTARGISLAGMTFGGADIVAVGERQKSNSRRLNRYLSSQRRKEIVAAVEQAIAEQLNRETGPSRRWHIEPVLNIEQLGRLDQTELRLVAEGGTPPWTGKQVFRLSTPDQDEPSHVAGFTVTANIEPVRLVVVSRVPIERGAIVRATDVELREVENHLPTQAITSLDRVVGMIAMRALRPETQLQSRDIRAPAASRAGRDGHGRCPHLGHPGPHIRGRQARRLPGRSGAGGNTR